jgi:hypothetical protein
VKREKGKMDSSGGRYEMKLLRFEGEEPAVREVDITDSTFQNEAGNTE